jgi:hypothetical protein
MAPLPRDQDVQLESLAFRPQKMTQWLSPPQLLRSASEVVVSGLFGKFADKRELQTWSQDVFKHDEGDVVWLDYASDVGDGFDSTYSIAWLLAQNSLAPGGEDLERGGVLVLGGDEVYPSATRKAYEDRFIGPYTAALPFVEPPAVAPCMYAVPGNHDWYDGLTAFLRVFCQRRWVKGSVEPQPRWIGGWQTPQQRSYFALRLPPPWWLWAVDIQFDTEIDQPQIDYFAAAANQLNPGDKLLLATAKPSWIHPREPSYRNLAFVERKLVPQDVDLVATLTGDLHHYSHYKRKREAADSVPNHRLTAGGGGAYMSATHTLPEELELPREPWSNESVQDAYECVDLGFYPTKDVSEGLRRGAVLAPWRTPAFVGFLAGLYALLAAGFFGAIRTDGAAAVPVGIIGLVVAGALIGYADFKGVAKWFVGAAHAAVHLVLAAGVAVAADQLASDLAAWAAVVVGGALVGAGAGTLLFGLYLFSAHRLGGRKHSHHTNEAFAGQRLTGHKCFLRMKVERDGPVTVYPIGVDEACSDWEFAERPDGRPTIVPAQDREPAVRLVEEGFELGA